VSSNETLEEDNQWKSYMLIGDEPKENLTGLNETETQSIV